MIDIQQLRADSTDCVNQLLRRGYQFPLAEFQALESQRKQLQTHTEGLKAQRNALSKEVGRLKAQGEDTAGHIAQVNRMAAELAENDQALSEVLAKLDEILAATPNLPEESVPDGADESANVVLKTWGDINPNLPQTDHVALGEALGQIDFTRAAKMSGARFVLLSGSIARLHRALGQWMIDTHVHRHHYVEVVPPLMVNAATLYGTGQLPKFVEDLFMVDRGQEAPYFLTPTAEVPLTNIVRDRILSEQELPLHLVALTTCFRSEAGSYGQDTRGMIRQHQFDKVELVHVVAPQHSAASLDVLTAHAEFILEQLVLPYRRVALCAGDLGFSARKTYDLEVWLPSQNTYREISSCSNCDAFQARRMKARMRGQGQKKPQLVHTLNGSGVAVGRALVAILENYQNKDGTITVPEVLRPYMANQSQITAEKLP